ncbi:MAG: molybdopterin synthase sulfur carrier subunit [Methanomicrobiales archaeon HGW-Methanomicrobiales-1]|jgi:molybdopterin synthase sulfur carrier subunit|nr:MAG: molybdopterin synthase sulfur carrier subunit [Methanomicrobiales archaeon HGW-Methanomicrobiales-1]
MTVKIRFFAQFRELLGTDIVTEVAPGTMFTSLITTTARKNPAGYAAIFNDKGMFHEFVILMQNGRRVEIADAAKTPVADGDEIAVFPPVAGG